MIGYVAAGLVVFATAVWVVSLYNQLVRVKHNVTRAWSNIDVSLKQRHDEIPKLVALCREYSGFEQSLLARLTEARTAAMAAREGGDATRVGPAESALLSNVSRVIALAEDYPELKANPQFLHLARRISGLETTIADRREFYNETVRINNVAIGQFPTNLIARRFGFVAATLLGPTHGR